MTGSHAERGAAWCVLGVALLLCGSDRDLAQTSTSGPTTPPTSAPTSAPSDEQLLQLGKATFDADAPAALEVKKARTGHLLVRPIANGHPAGWFIFDTGAGVCCVTSSSGAELRLERIGEIGAIGGGGQAKAPVYRARELKLGPLHCADHPLMAVDLAFLEQHLGEKVSGIIGFGVLSQCVAVVDLEQATVELHDPGRYKLSRGTWTALDLSKRVPVITAAFEGHEGRFLLDTGDHGHVSFDEPAVRKWNLLEGRELTDSKLGGVGGFIAAKKGKIAKLEIGGVTLADLPATFAVEAKGTHGQTERAGKIGAGVLQQFVLVVDYGQQRMALLARADGTAEKK